MSERKFLTTFWESFDSTRTTLAGYMSLHYNFSFESSSNLLLEAVKYLLIASQAHW